jgi:hypothetical protein
MSSGHTLGPWIVDEPAGDYAGVAEAIESDDRIIAWTADSLGSDSIDGKLSEEDKANARLIAAAPDLLATLKAVLKGIPDGYDDAHTLTLLARVEWAINKAKGVKSVCECCSAPPCQEQARGE